MARNLIAAAAVALAIVPPCVCTRFVARDICARDWFNREDLAKTKRRTGQISPAFAPSNLGIRESGTWLKRKFPISPYGRSQCCQTLVASLVRPDEEGEVAIDGADNETEQRYLRFSGVGRLYSQTSTQEGMFPRLDVVDRLNLATCVVVGVGGVGSWAAEALCRSGVGNIILIDMDEVCISNTNRQLHALSSSVGRSKVEETRNRLVDINPDCNVTNIFDFVTMDNVNELIDQLPAHAICLDCIDGQREKAALIAACCDRSIPVVTCGGAAGRSDPTKIVCDDLTKAQEDRLLFKSRKLLRQEYGWPKGPSQGEKNTHKVKKWNIPAVFSTEVQKSIPQGETSSLRRCDGALGTACFVTGTYGFVAASRVVSMIANDERISPTKPER